MHRWFFFFSSNLFRLYQVLIQWITLFFGKPTKQNKWIKRKKSFLTPSLLLFKTLTLNERLTNMVAASWLIKPKLSLSIEGHENYSHLPRPISTHPFQIPYLSRFLHPSCSFPSFFNLCLQKYFNTDTINLVNQFRIKNIRYFLRLCVLQKNTRVNTNSNKRYNINIKNALV